MSTIRTDPVTGRRVIIASERADRPRSFRDDDSGLPYTEHCPFCVGNEDATPEDIRTYPDGDGGWSVRVVPNKYPAVHTNEELNDRSDELYESYSGVGAHEVIIESPDHVVDLVDLSDAQVATVLKAWRERVADLERDERLEHVLPFKNHGAPAGASIEHAHSQLIALPMVPERIQDELDGAQAHHEETGGCVYCDIIDKNLQQRDRLVYADDDVVVLAPFAPRFPFELTILPREHQSRFEHADAGLDRSMAAALNDTLGRLNRALDSPPYNLAVHTAPLRQGELPYFHWHIELIPTLSHIAGFEWGSGYHINPTSPESAARHLRDIAAETPTVTSADVG